MLRMVFLVLQALAQVRILLSCPFAVSVICELLVDSAANDQQEGDLPESPVGAPMDSVVLVPLSAKIPAAAACEGARVFWYWCIHQVP